MAEIIVDNDVSAYSGRKRPGYARLIDGIDAGTFDAVVVWHPDRLHRSPRELEDFITLVERTGIDVGTVTAGDWDLSTPDGRLTARIVGSVARKESEDKSRRLRRKHLEIAQAGRPTGGGARAFGFEPDKVTVREAEAVEIRDAVARFLAGESVRSITADWERRVPSVTGARWSATAVTGIISSPRIAGQREHRGAVVDAVWPAIVEPGDVLRVRAVMAARRREPSRAPRTNMLIGLVECGLCGARMSSHVAAKAQPRYACVSDRGGCGRCGISAANLEWWVAESLFQRLDATTVKPTVATAGSAPDPLAVLVDLDRRAAELAEMFAVGEIRRPEWAVASDAIERQRIDAEGAVAREAVTASVVPLAGRGDEVRAWWASATVGAQRARVESMLDGRIVVGPWDPAGGKFDPRRVAIPWRS